MEDKQKMEELSHEQIASIHGILEHLLQKMADLEAKEESVETRWRELCAEVADLTEITRGTIAINTFTRIYASCPY